MAQIKIKQVKSRIGAPAVQKRTLDALGLKKMNHTVVKDNTPSVMGMVNRVRHLVEVTNACTPPLPRPSAQRRRHGEA